MDCRCSVAAPKVQIALSGRKPNQSQHPFGVLGNLPTTPCAVDEEFLEPCHLHAFGLLRTCSMADLRSTRSIALGVTADCGRMTSKPEHIGQGFRTTVPRPSYLMLGAATI